MGFPNRPSRAQFGPTFVDSAPVRDPARQPGQALINLLAHQAAGLGVVSARAMAVATIVAGPDVSLLAHAEAWNPDARTAPPYDPPVVARVSAGLFHVDYLAQYPDDQGDPQPVQPLAAVAYPRTADPISPLIHIARAIPSATIPPAGKFRYDVHTLAWEIGVSTDWALADAGFLFLLW